MALAYRLNGRRHLVYAVVLGQRGGNVLAPAGAAAYALATSAEASQAHVVFQKGAVLGTIGFGKRVVTRLASRDAVTCTGGTNTTRIH